MGMHAHHRDARRGLTCAAAPDWDLLSGSFTHGGIRMRTRVAGLALLAIVVPVVVAQKDKPRELPNKAGWNVEADPMEVIKGPFDTESSIPSPSAATTSCPPRRASTWPSPRR